MDIKPTLLLAAALFLISAPEPDSRAVAEMTRNFIVPTDERALQAAEIPQRNQATDARKTEVESRSAEERTAESDPEPRHED